MGRVAGTLSLHDLKIKVSAEDANAGEISPRRRRATTILLIILVASVGTLAGLKLDFDRRDALLWFASDPGVMTGLRKVEELTPPGSVVLCWWDYGRGVQEVSHRVAVETRSSREIWESTGSSRDFLWNLEQQLFGRWGSNEKIQTVARAFTLPEDDALPLIRSLNASYVLVFYPDDAEKFTWIARTAGLKPEDYLSFSGGTYAPTEKGFQLTIIRLLFDDTARLEHFEKLYDDGRTKIYKVLYLS